ncbi:hypothetical protein HNY73_009360 [Argiope bruennichi]|uniref:Uncharacterized protein n=1 Tax=Argiope bruennichi TaxID=94029 RepID=A0A8T0FC02_ARGBR|nr:hypothetical protein HNY73_009360 [Argiope bruennichi]
MDESRSSEPWAVRKKFFPFYSERHRRKPPPGFRPRLRNRRIRGSNEVKNLQWIQEVTIGLLRMLITV